VPVIAKMKIVKKRRPADTTQKRYGVEPFNRAASDAAVLLDAIRSDLADVDFFTREDLIHLDCFSHVATITRYQKVREAVSVLLARKELTAMSRTDLALPANRKIYAERGALHDHYSGTVLAILKRMTPKSEFTVMDVVNAWTTTDLHLTLNVKRVLTRAILQSLRREGMVADAGEYLYALRS